MLDPDIINQRTKGTPLARKNKKLEAELRAKPTTPQFTQNLPAVAGLFGGLPSLQQPTRLNLGVEFFPMKTPEQENTKNLTNDEHSTCKNSQAEFKLNVQPECPAECSAECPSSIHPNSAAPYPTKSTIPSKLPPDILAAVHEALVAPDRLSYGLIFENFDLGRKGISFTAFYNYARPIRLAEACNMQAGLGRTLAPDANKMFPDLIATRLIAALVDETVTPRQIKNLVDAYRMASNLDLAHRRLEKEEIEKMRKSKSRDLGDLARAVKEYTNATRAERKQSYLQSIKPNDEGE